MVIVIPIQKPVNIECPAHAHAVRHHIGMLQRKVHRMISSKTASRHRQPRRLILPAHKRQKLMQNVAFVLQMSHHPHPRMHALVVPALRIHGVRTEHLQLAALNLRRQHSNHCPVFILEKPSHRSRKGENRRPRMPEDQRLHVALQFLAVPLVIFAILDEERPATPPYRRCLQHLPGRRSIFRDVSVNGLFGEEGKRLGSGETYWGTAALGCPAERTLDWLFSPSPKTGDLPTRAAAALATVPHIVYARARQRRLDTLLI